MKLIELEPEFVYQGNPATRGFRKCPDFSQAQGIIFLCPVCFRKNGGPIGTHSILVWFKDRGVPDEMEPKPARWEASGRGFSDLTLKPSIDISMNSPGEWHGFITNGEVT